MANTRISGANVIAAASGHVIPIYSGTPDEAPQATTAASIAALAGGGGLPLMANVITGNYYTGLTYRMFFSAITLDTWNGKLVAMPFVRSETKTFNRIGVRCDTSNAGANGRLGIYEAGADGLPDALLLDAGEVDLSGTGDIELTISQSLTANTLYWLAGCFENNAICEIGLGANLEALGSLFWGGSSTFGDLVMSVSRSHVYGALPATFGAATLEPSLSIPGIWLRSV